MKEDDGGRRIRNSVLIQLLLVPLHNFLSNYKRVLCVAIISLCNLYFLVKPCRSCADPKWQSGKEILLRTLVMSFDFCKRHRYVKFVE